MSFSYHTRYIISLLSSGRCANPVCRKQLVENNKLIGEFCHIEGKKLGSARYNPTQTEIQRNDHRNGIILCPSCHTLVDKDETTYTTDILNSWKKNDEESPKLKDWLQKDILSVRVLAKLEKELPIRPAHLLGERSLFVGRIEEIGQLSQLIASGVKILSLVGEGGIGKTSVSIKLVRQIENSYALTIPLILKKDMNYLDFLLEVGKFIDFSFVNDLRPEELENLIREIIGKIGRVLLWVDNYENVADFIDTVSNNDLLNIHTFLETLPESVTIILNSRNRSNLEGETIINIKGLSQEDSMKLFVQMAKRHLTNPMSSEMESKINEMCQLVEGHPLAIKLVGGAYKGGGTGRLSEMLHELHLAIKNTREPTTRLRSINACFDYSHRRLSPRLRKALSRLALLKTHFTSDAASEIFGIEESILLELYERTLLQRSAIPSKGGDEIFVYDFHPIIRKYLQGKSPGILTFTPHELYRYVAHYSDFIRSLYDNYRNDVSKYSTLVDLLTAYRINDFYEAISLVSDERERSVISNLLGLLLLQTGHKTRALFYHELCYEIDNRLGELERVANDLNNIGACYSEHVYSGEALCIHNRLAIEYHDDKRYKDSAKQYVGSGLIYFRKGDYEKAEDSFRDALSNFRKGNGSKRDIADTLMNLSNVLLKLKKYQDAIDSSIETVPLYEQIGDYLSIASVHSNLSIVYRKRGGPGDLDAALKSIRIATDIDLREKNTRGLIRDYRVMSKAYRKMNDEENASIFDASAIAAITDFERETHEPFTDTGYHDFLEYFN